MAYRSVVDSMIVLHVLLKYFCDQFVGCCCYACTFSVFDTKVNAFVHSLPVNVLSLHNCI